MHAAVLQPFATFECFCSINVFGIHIRGELHSLRIESESLSILCDVKTCRGPSDIIAKYRRRGQAEAEGHLPTRAVWLRPSMQTLDGTD